MAILSKYTTIGGKIPLTTDVIQYDATANVNITLSGSIDLNNITDAATYTITDVTTITNFPENYTVENINLKGLVLIVLAATDIARIQILIDESTTLTRYKSNDNVWNSWVSGVDSLSSLLEKSNSSNAIRHVSAKIEDDLYVMGENSFAYGENAQTIGNNSIALGPNNISGCIGWYIKAIDFELKQIYVQRESYDDSENCPYVISGTDSTSLIQGSKAYDDSITLPYTTGQYLCIKNKTYYSFKVTVKSVTDNCIEYDGDLGFTNFVANDGTSQNYTVWVPECSDSNGVIVLGNSSFTEGNNNIVAHSFGHAEGYNSIVGGKYGHAEGNSTKAGASAHSEGNETIAYGENSHAEGLRTQAINDITHAEGSRTTASGYISHAEGAETIAEGYISHAEGYKSKALAEQTHAEGYGTQALGKNSHSEGNETKVEGENSHAEGYKTEATGNNSHAEGKNSKALGASSHAEGEGTIAKEAQSHAEGYGTQAGYRAHSEGSQTQALGEYAHSEGYLTEAAKEGSHAEGRQTKATAKFAHSEGYGTVANGEAQHVEGKWNVSDSTKAHILGWGTNDANRKNIHTIDTNGNAWFAGNIFAGDISLMDMERFTNIISEYITDFSQLNKYYIEGLYLFTFEYDEVTHTQGMMIISSDNVDMDRGWRYQYIFLQDKIIFRKLYTVADADALSGYDITEKEISMLDLVTNSNNSNIQDSVIIKSSTENSNKQFKLTIDDNGVISTEEV